MIHRPKTAAFTLNEILVSLTVGAIAIGFIFMSYLALQRGFAFAINWSETRIAQVRVIDSMAQDLRNAITVTANAGSLPLTLSIPVRFSAYEPSGAMAGDPQIGSTMYAPSISSSTGKLVNGNGTITVIYEQSGNLINRRVQQSGIINDATRTVGVFGGGVSISFQNRSGAAFTSADDTIVPIVSATTSSWNSKQTVSTTITDTVFLRGASYK